MEINFFVIWFIISPFIILYLYLKNKEYKNKTENIIEQINDVWDKDYKLLIQTYGTVDNFIDCHTKDFDIIRSNLVTIYSNISDINRKYMTNTEKLLKLIEDNTITKKEIYDSIKSIRRITCVSFDDLLNNFNTFVVAEEEAHQTSKQIADILEKIDEEYKNNNIYKEVKND